MSILVILRQYVLWFYYLWTYGNKSLPRSSFTKSSNIISHNVSAYKFCKQTVISKICILQVMHFNHFLEQHKVTCELNILKASPSIWKWNAGVSIFRRECHFLPVLVSKPVPSHRLRQSYWTDFPSSSTELLNNGSTVSGWIAHKTVLGPKWNST